jgi:ectoine hydroxylase-related dioxygenase (phytanoyl-CoA dioxygenase family)
MQTAIDTIQFGAPASVFAAAIERSGAVIVENALSPEDIGRINAEFEPHLAAHPIGLTSGDDQTREFFGHRTRRVMSAVSISETYRKAFLENDIVWSYATEILRPISEHIRLSTDGVFEIHPGEKAQVLHRDGDLLPYFGAMGPEGPDIVVNMLIALTDITADMGATRVIPGSHKWPATREIANIENGFSTDGAVSVEVKAGTMYAINGRIVHGGGANVTAGTKRRVLACGFAPAWLVPEHAYVWSVPPALAQEFSPRLRTATCYGSVHHRDPIGGSMWNFHFNDLKDHLKFG